MIEIIQADITTLDVDAIVNAANSGLAGGGGVDGAIHWAAGPELARASSRLAPCPPGHAVITPGFRLAARFVIHAVGPVWHGGWHDEPAILRRTYESAFRLAREQSQIRSIAFPAISTGAYGYPKQLAATIALQVMRENDDAFERIVACLFDSDNLEPYRRSLADAIAGAAKVARHETQLKPR
jgi:O-acetyl-ADP-ribose deacetylase (regulator of RNase III)